MFVPSWVLLVAFIIGVVVYSCICVIVYKMEENQQELEERRPSDVIAIVCAFAVAFFLIVFLVCFSASAFFQICVSFILTKDYPQC